MDEKKFWEIVKFAIEKESLSHDFYVKASEAARFRRTKDILTGFALEEKEQKEILQNIFKERKYPADIISSFDLNLDDYFKDEEFKPGMTLGDTRWIAIRIEEYSIKLYRDLMEATGNKDLKNIFCRLSEKEKEHKRRFEEETFGK